MRLTGPEQAMLDGAEGPARQRAMDLLVRYGDALGAERFVDTTNIAGVPGSSTLALRNYYQRNGGASFEDVFSRFDLDSDESVPLPPIAGNCCHLQGGMDPELWAEQGMSRAAFEHQRQDEAEMVRRGIRVLKTCTPYLAGNMPAYGEHCAWMESSAVVFCNSVAGARTNTEGRESTSAAMLTGKIPDWGFHRTEYRFGTHHIDVEVPVESVMDWGMLGYFVGDIVQEHIPILTGRFGRPDLVRHKHFGAAAASIWSALSSQHPKSSDTARCKEGSMERRGLWINGLKLNEASGSASATQIACRPFRSFMRASISSPS